MADDKQNKTDKKAKKGLFDNFKHKDYIEEFDAFARAKRTNVIYFVGALCFAFLIVLIVVFFGYRTSVNAVNKVLVIDRSGEYIQTFSEEQEKLFQALIYNTCAQTTKLVNSFDRMTIRENQAKALFYANETDLDIIFNKYNTDASYYEALQNGVVYSCVLEDFQQLTGDHPPYQVSFTSILSVEYNSGVVNYRIYSTGELIKTTPKFPENVTGFFFRKYEQNLIRVDLEEEAKQRRAMKAKETQTETEN